MILEESMESTGKEFRFFDLGLPARLVMAGGLFALGAAAELFLPLPFIVGAAVAALGWIPLALLPATNRPKDQGREEWRLVGMKEVDRLDESLRETRKLRAKMRSPLTLLLFLVLLPLLLIVLFAGMAAHRGDLVYVALNAVVFLVPALFFGRVKLFVPATVAMKMPCFRAVLAEKAPEGLVFAPYIRFDKDEKGLDVPEDLRLLLELKRPPEDLVGIQIQAAVNNGPNGAVPYLYAVVLTHGASGPAHARAARFKARGYEIEPGGDGEYGTVVIRQETSGGGYCTTPDDCRRLASLCFNLLASLQTAS
jgi:hypothetical protein